MRRALLRGAEALGAARLLAWRRRHPLRILMYHGVTPEPLPVPCWHMLDERDLRAQLEHVARRYRVLPLSEALRRLYEGSLPPGSAALTFDDGYLNNRSVAFPLLQRLGLPATIFLVSDMVGGAGALWPDRLYLAFARARAARVDLAALGLPQRTLHSPAERARAYADAVRALKGLAAGRKDEQLERLVAVLNPAEADDPGPFRLMGWDDVRALSGSGLVDFGGHTTRHEILRHQPDDEVRCEVEGSHRRVAAETGTVPGAFAYPNGRAQDFDARAQAAVREVGLSFALATTQGLARPTSDPYAVPRLCVGSDLPLWRFRLLLAGGR